MVVSLFRAPSRPLANSRLLLQLSNLQLLLRATIRLALCLFRIRDYRSYSDAGRLSHPTPATQPELSGCVVRVRGLLNRCTVSRSCNGRGDFFHCSFIQSGRHPFNPSSPGKENICTAEDTNSIDWGCVDSSYCIRILLRGNCGEMAAVEVTNSLLSTARS